MRHLFMGAGLGLAFFVSVFEPGTAKAETTREMLSFCQRTSANAVLDESFCLGYISGVLDTQSLILELGNSRYYCLPTNGISVNEAQALVESYSARYPEDMEKDFLGTLFLTLAERYPCY
ncbi:MAG TPA: Rap1a/Tai family immunity protein [Sphingomonadales bacterium]|nr:Rap1a/Tai family immunity protein [Sphingomonadales bacterium]